MSLFKRAGAILVAVFLTLGLMAPQTARADATTDKSITNASAWIADTWKNDRRQFFAAGTIADGVIALSAANEKPDTVRSMLVDLKKEGPAYVNIEGGYPAGLAKMILTADVAGQNPRTFFGCERDLVAELMAMTQARPSESREYWGPYLIAIALSRSGEKVPAWVIADMEKNQGTGGGFGYKEGATFIGDPDYTALGISAMDSIARNPKNVGDKARATASVGMAEKWSADTANRKTDNGNYYWESYSSANSTGMLASALGEVGVEITSPVRYLTSQQNDDGGWAASHNGKNSNVMATTQAILGVIGEGYGTARSTQVPEMSKCGTTPPTTTPSTPAAPQTVYNTPGERVVNGRKWSTTCAAYSSTVRRCRAEIWATTVTQVNGRFVVKNGYAFNNLTYLPSPRSQWKTNPLGAYGKVNGTASWKGDDGRQWRTECDNALTGRGGCRSYAVASVVETITRPSQSTQYKWVTKEIFNNMVQFSK